MDYFDTPYVLFINHKQHGWVPKAKRTQSCEDIFKQEPEQYRVKHLTQEPCDKAYNPSTGIKPGHQDRCSEDWKTDKPLHQVTRRVYTPAEVQQGPSWLGNALIHPGQEVELSHGTRLVGPDVLQVETAHQEVLAPDVLRHQVDLEIKKENNCSNAEKKKKERRRMLWIEEVLKVPD